MKTGTSLHFNACMVTFFYVHCMHMHWACIITEDKDKHHATAIAESEGSSPLHIKEKENTELEKTKGHLVVNVIVSL